jgi:16S rRNA (guanine527-N7)-methyltransferase
MRQRFPIYNQNSMQLTRIAELLAPFLGDASDQQLAKEDLAHISTYIDILLRWNARINLTAIRDPEEIVSRHFGESLFAARHLFPGRRAALQGGVMAESKSGASAHQVSLADIGSGAGFPGIPIKLWTPQINLTLIESNYKKATFLREVTRALTLTDVNIQGTRAENLTGMTFDGVTLRAVERFASVLPTAARLVAPAGRLVLLISSAQLPQARMTLTEFARLAPAWSNRLEVIEAVPRSSARLLAVVSPGHGNQIG